MNDIGFDVDGVLAAYVQAFLDYVHMTGQAPDTLPRSEVNILSWDLNGHIDVWNRVRPQFEKNPFFWLGIRKYDSAQRVMKERGVQPAAYVTARPICSDVTAYWLKANGFPDAPVVTVDWKKPEEKLQVLRDLGITRFIDDRIGTADELHDAGIESYLLSCPHNRELATRAIRVHSIEEMLDQLC